MRFNIRRLSWAKTKKWEKWVCLVLMYMFTVYIQWPSVLNIMWPSKWTHPRIIFTLLVICTLTWVLGWEHLLPWNFSKHKIFSHPLFPPHTYYMSPKSCSLAKFVISIYVTLRAGRMHSYTYSSNQPNFRKLLTSINFLQNTHFDHCRENL